MMSRLAEVFATGGLLGWFNGCSLLRSRAYQVLAFSFHQCPLVEITLLAHSQYSMLFK